MSSHVYGFVLAGADQAADQIEEGSEQLAEGVSQAGDQVADAVRQARDALKDAPPPEELVDQARDAVDDAIDSARGGSQHTHPSSTPPSPLLLLPNMLALDPDAVRGSEGRPLQKLRPGLGCF